MGPQNHPELRQGLKLCILRLQSHWEVDVLWDKVAFSVEGSSWKDNLIKRYQGPTFPGVRVRHASILKGQGCRSWQWVHCPSVCWKNSNAKRIILCSRNSNIWLWFRLHSTHIQLALSFGPSSSTRWSMVTIKFFPLSSSCFLSMLGSRMWSHLNKPIRSWKKSH